MKPFTDLMDLILSPLKSAAAQSAQNLATGIGTTVQLGLTLYIILFGWQVARGEIAEPWNEFAKRAVKLGIIVALIQSTGVYQEYVIDFLAGSLPDALSNALSSRPIPDANAFDTLARQVAILLTQVWQGTGWSAPAATARAAVVTLLVMPFLWGALIVGFVVTLWAKAGMYFVAALGPLFIALAMFEQTRKYLHNWLDQIVSMIALQILVALTCGLVIQGLEKATKSAPTPDTVFALAGQVIVLAVFSLAVWSSLPRLASKLGGYGASLAGAGSRAAPFETLRAPFGSFNEHGRTPPGRPELATIAPRGGDPRTTAPIVPSPVVSGNDGSTVGGLSHPAAPSSAREAEPAAPAQAASTPETVISGRANPSLSAATHSASAPVPEVNAAGMPHGLSESVTGGGSLHTAAENQNARVDDDARRSVDAGRNHTGRSASWFRGHGVRKRRAAGLGCRTADSHGTSARSHRPDRSAERAAPTDTTRTLISPPDRRPA